MKHLLAILLVLLLSASASSAQDSVAYRSPYRDLRPVTCRLVAETNASGRYHGKYVLTGSDRLNSGQRNDMQQYTEVRTYADGLLHGSFSQKYLHQGSGQISGRFTISHNWTVEGRFFHGVPDGSWTFAVNSKYSSYAEKENVRLREVVSFEHGRVTSITDHAGNHIDIDPQGLISGVGTLKDGTRVILSRSVITNTCLDLLGDAHPMTTEQTFMLRKYLDGEWSIFQLADHGYTIDRRETFLSQWSRFAEHADRYARLGSLAPNYQVPPYSVRLGQLREIQLAPDAKAVEYYVQSTPTQFDEMMSRGYFVGPYGRRYFSSNAANMVLQRWSKDQAQLLSRRLSAVARDQADADWNAYLSSCGEDGSRTAEMFAPSLASPRRLVDEKFRPLFPIVGHQVDSVVWQPHSGFVAHCIIHKMAPDSVGFESYAVLLPHDMDRRLLADQMDPSAYRRVPNAWDTVYAFERQLAQQHSRVLSTMHQEHRQSYRAYYDSLLADRTILVDVRMADLRDLDTLQQQLIANAPYYRQIESLQLELKHTLQPYKRLSRAFREYQAASRPEWDSPTEYLAQLLDRHQQLLRAASSQDLNDLERRSRRTRQPLDLLTE